MTALASSNKPSSSATPQGYEQHHLVTGGGQDKAEEQATFRLSTPSTGSWEKRMVKALEWDQGDWFCFYPRAATAHRIMSLAPCITLSICILNSEVDTYEA